MQGESQMIQRIRNNGIAIRGLTMAAIVFFAAMATGSTFFEAMLFAGTATCIIAFWLMAKESV
jgi:hypothetical protein